MNNVVICQALIRVEGLLNSIPDGFEQPREDLVSLFVKEINIGSSSFDAAINDIIDVLEKARDVLLRLAETEGVKLVLHLDVSVNELDYVTVNVPLHLSKVLSDLSIQMEMTVMTL